MEPITVQEIMEEFRSRTGLGPMGSGPVHRYLWTDAFAVCNYLTLYKKSNSDEYLHLALSLVDQVHENLGRFSHEDMRQGWISGLDERDGRLHPTGGGLRIGKKLPERQVDEPFDERLEWERDGQYYHYLTKWMHTLCCVSRTVNNPVYATWAAELAERAYSAFSYTAGDGSQRLYWKMSIDLSRPQVSSMGHHDPLDGLITSIEIRDLVGREPGRDSNILESEIAALAEMCRGVNWTTPDPLGLGGLLADAWHLVQLQNANAQIPLPNLLQDKLEAAAVGLSIYARDNSMHLPPDYRLAFRELGLAIGLQAVGRIGKLFSQAPETYRKQSRLKNLVESLNHYLPLWEQIEEFWLDPENREAASWQEHADINMVMLATCLAPDSFLDIE